MTIRVGGRYGFSRPSMEKIYDATLSASGRFDVTGIPGSFNHLKVILVARSDGASTTDVLHVFFNGDTTAGNYRRGRIQGAVSSVSYAQADDGFTGNIPASSSPANYFGRTEIDIPSYASTAYEKIVKVTSVARADATSNVAYLITKFWESTAAINQVTLQPDGYATDEFIATSRLEIYGIR